ncbi:MAG: DUF4158 domain-containing protein, partial [Deltaproteobacteria bacterium]|nr:DUF4158 domain-containing protein [Deltaproteobacteria bacterium]
MLSAWDLAQLGNKIGATRLGFAVLLKFFKRQGRFPSFKNEVADQLISFVAAQVGVVPEASQAALEALLSTEEQNGWQEGQAGQQPQDLKDVQASGTTILQHIRKDPGRVGLATMLEEMAKLRSIRELQLPDNLFPGVARKVLTVYRNRASIEEPSRLRAHSKAKRLTYLSALCFMHASYSHHYRRMVPEMLDILYFRSNNERYRPVMIALQIVKNYVRNPCKYYPDHEILPIKKVVAPKWREFVVEQDDDGTIRVN